MSAGKGERTAPRSTTITQGAPLGGGPECGGRLDAPARGGR